MQNILPELISILSQSNSLIEGISKSITSHAKVLNIGYAFIKSEGFDPVIYSSEFDENSKLEYKEENITITIYKGKNQEIWTDEQKDLIATITKLISISCSKYLLKKELIEVQNSSNILSLPSLTYFKSRIDCISQDDLKNYNSYYLNIKSIDLINYSYGKKTGDLVIKSFGEGISAYLNPDEIVAHLGADKFAVILRRNRNDEFLRLVSMFNIHQESKDISFSLQVSAIAGICELTSSTKYEDVVTFAELAYKYARNEKIPYAYFKSSLFEISFKEKEIEASFKNDLNDGSYVSYYQPKVDIATGRIIGCEALARRIKDGVVQSPASFVPTLEQANIIVDLDLHILECACRDINQYCNEGRMVVPISCNLSRRDLEVQDIDKIVLGIINKYPIAKDYIIIELTETSNIKERTILQKFIATMRKNNIRVSIDDFGSGYSSLSTLRDFKVSEIKIDRSFIDKKIYESDKVIISSIIKMAKKLGIHVICEGVETKKQAELLLSLGCGNAQGYLYDKPLPKLEFEQRLDMQYYVV